LSVRLTPGAQRDEISGWQDGALLVRVRARPVQGAANQALLRLLAQRLSLAPSALAITHGATSRSKRVRVQGLDAAEMRQRLGV
jgi:uncharacterized protein YggU (UPF0235/DUF167 family)